MRPINPTIKAASVMLSAIIIAFSFSALWMLILIGFCLISIIVFGGDIKRILKALIPATLAAGALMTAIYMSGDAKVTIQVGMSFKELAANSAAERAIAVGVRIYAYFFLGLTFALTTDNIDFIYSLMEQCRLKPKYAYGILAAFNLMPQIRREIKQIRLAYRVRGWQTAGISARVLFSALVNAMRWSENLAMAMESKGFEENGMRTYHRVLKIRTADVIWGLMPAAIAVCSVVIK